MGLKVPPAVSTVLAALGALSIGWRIWTSRNASGEDGKAAREEFSPNEGIMQPAEGLGKKKPTPGNDESLYVEEIARKRPPSDKTSPEHTKRLRTRDRSSAVNGKEKGPVTDISALMAAKTAVPDTDQSDPEKLGQHYASMASKFESEGLNKKAVEDARLDMCRKYYSIDGARVEPLRYLDFPTPLARGAVRLGVFRIIDNESYGFADLLSTATKEIAKAFPEGALFHYNRKDHYHLTVQMISHPSNPRPDSGTLGGGLDHQNSLSMIPAPSHSVLNQETSTYKEIANAISSPELTVHSIIFADSGTLLLLFTDTTGRVYQLRKSLASAFPGAVEKQPSILHVTLARLLSAEDLDKKQRDRIIAACSDWTQKLKGTTFKPQALWYDSWPLQLRPE